jgi:hypothetical protein
MESVDAASPFAAAPGDYIAGRVREKWILPWVCKQGTRQPLTEVPPRVLTRWRKRAC